MPLQHYTGDALLQIGLIVKVRFAKTSFTPDSESFYPLKFPAIRYMPVKCYPYGFTEEVYVETFGV